MKIRNGFVSNSSTSSFVIVGVKLTKKEYKDKFGNDAYTSIEEAELDCVWDENIVGKFLACTSSDDYEIEEKEYTFAELQTVAEEVSNELSVPLDQVKVYTGVMST